MTVKWGKPQTRRLPVWQYAESPVMIVPITYWHRVETPITTAPNHRVAIFARGVTPCYPPTCNIVPRIVDAELAERLAATGAVVVEGPKACGKTGNWQARGGKRGPCLTSTETPDAMVGVDPDAVLRGRTPRLIDEWQTEPDIWNYVRRAVDDRPLPASSSSQALPCPPDDITRHTGAGRLTRLRIRPFSLFEAGTFLRGHLATTANER